MVLPVLREPVALTGCGQQSSDLRAILNLQSLGTSLPIYSQKTPKDQAPLPPCSANAFPGLTCPYGTHVCTIPLSDPPASTSPVLGLGVGYHS
ncbi:rCG25891 [Rattus norvegicus]|uniref:RCG25891 n=1 Tax=Rattus norvegicus TaxID=10116 RepID=A6I3G3_RAT|nr:rCG25891 [Rattus norvegicus]